MICFAVQTVRSGLYPPLYSTLQACVSFVCISFCNIPSTYQIKQFFYCCAAPCVFQLPAVTGATQAAVSKDRGPRSKRVQLHNVHDEGERFGMSV